MTNRIVDLARGMDLVHEGTVDQGNFGMAPYVVYGGIDTYSHRPSGPLKGLNGLTAGGWFQFADACMLMGVWDSASDNVWNLSVSGTTPEFTVSDDGTTEIGISSTSAAINTWHFLVVKFDPGAEISIFLNGVKYEDTVSVPGALYDTTTEFSIGGDSSGGSLLTGRASHCFCSSSPLPDGQIMVLYHAGKRLYGK